MQILPMFRMIFRSMLRGPATIRYPAEPAKQTPATRGHLVFVIDDCIYCGLCRMHCPSQAIEVSKPDRTWQVDLFRCIICGNCVGFCPKDCLTIAPTYQPPSPGPVINRYQGTIPAEQLTESTDNQG